MPDPSTLPDRLRFIAAQEYGDLPGPGASAQDEAKRATLHDAADVLEQHLALVGHERPEAHRTPAVPGEVYLGATLDALIAPPGHRFVATVETIDVADGVLSVPDPDARRDAVADLDTGWAMGKAYTGSALRRFVTVDDWLDNEANAPGPGAFVILGPAGALWRLHAYDRLKVGGRLAEVEPVDPHDVPVLSEVVELPLPVVEVVDGQPEAYTVKVGPSA